MIDFAKSIHQGLDAASTADGERAEIRSILDRLDLAIQSATFGKARLHVGEFHNAQDERVMSIADQRERLVIQSTENDREGRIIAGWTTGTEGDYPVTLVYNFLSIPCSHGDELMEELSVLLETARVGRAIRQFAT